MPCCAKDCSTRCLTMANTVNGAIGRLPRDVRAYIANFELAALAVTDNGIRLRGAWERLYPGTKLRGCMRRHVCSWRKLTCNRGASVGSATEGSLRVRLGQLEIRRGPLTRQSRAQDPSRAATGLTREARAIVSLPPTPVVLPPQSARKRPRFCRGR
jgi:hypothetical protein